MNALLATLLSTITVAVAFDVPNHVNCSNHGILLNNHCYCEPGATGEKCGVKTCYPKCSTHGSCVVTKGVAACECDISYTGDSCAEKTCPNNCFEKEKHGKCITVPAEFNGGVAASKECFCSPKYTGRDCARPRGDVRMAANNSSNATLTTLATSAIATTNTTTAAAATTPTPTTLPTVKSTDAASKTKTKKRCPGDDGPCNGNGICEPTTNKCTCNPGWYGKACGTLPCPNNCFADLPEPHGECVEDRCACKTDFQGEDCGTPTPVALDLACSQTCPKDCEHAADCADYNLRYWAPVFHRNSKTTDRIYTWVTPKTGFNQQWMLNQAAKLGHRVPMDDQKAGQAARDCYMKCVRSCASKCFYELHEMTDIERKTVAKIQNLDKRLPGISGNQVNDETRQADLQNQGKQCVGCCVHRVQVG